MIAPRTMQTLQYRTLMHLARKIAGETKDKNGARALLKGLALLTGTKTRQPTRGDGNADNQ